MKLNMLLCILTMNLHAFAQLSGAYTGNFDEPFRPAFHFTPQQAWINDPNGLVYLNGKYHLFYQYYPDDVVWGPMHWGHAISSDLIHWQHQPIALYPDSLGWIFSGSAVIDKENTAGFGNNAMIAIFTYHNDAIWKQGKKNTESQGIAFSLDEGKSWMKYSGNPVLNNSGEQDFRDPKVFRNHENSNWNMVLAAGDRIKIFSSDDLKHWKFESDYQPAVPADYGIWECPDLFRMTTGTETKWVMTISQTANAPNGGTGTRYFIGDFNGKTFRDGSGAGWFDFGKDFYAAVTFDNVPDEKRILLGWMSNWQYATVTPTAPWRSAMTMPRELILIKTPDGHRLQQKIASQFATIREPSFQIKKVRTPYKKADWNFSRSYISMESIDVTDQLHITCSNNSGESFLIKIDGKQVTMDRSKSGIINFSEQFASKEQILIMDEPIKNVQLLIDHSSVELLLNDGTYSMTNQVFPQHAYNSLEISSKPEHRIRNLKIDAVKSIWVK